MSLDLHLRNNFKQRKNVLQGGNEMHIFGNDIVESRLRSDNNRRKNSAKRRKKIVLSCSTLYKVSEISDLNGKLHVIKRSRDFLCQRDNVRALLHNHYGPTSDTTRSRLHG